LKQIDYGVVVHGGVGSPKTLTDGCRDACAKAFSILESGGTSLDAVTEAVCMLEDDGRFNAGSGSALRMDGRTIEMDASVMDSVGRIGVVLAVQNIKNPILLARAVTETPHVALAGYGALLLARLVGLPEHNNISETAILGFEKTRQQIKAGRLTTKDLRWRNVKLKDIWNFDLPYESVFSHDTVGAVAKDKGGCFAVASSTGGASPMMLGRVGDTGFPGSGFYAGQAAAVAVTGIGEEIIRHMLARTVYNRIVNGNSLETVCREAISSFPQETPIGLIAITPQSYSIKANMAIPAYSLVKRI
jgi:L-asparaginase / beta-aspartyl-peptidase